MSKNYSPKHFLRKSPNYLLKQYFEKMEVLGGINWDELGETDVGPIIEALEQLPEPVQIRIEQEFRQINEMACPTGTRCLLDEAESIFHKLQIADKFEEMSDHYERGFWMFVNHAKVFDIAESHLRMDCVGAWKHCAVFSGLEPNIEPEDLGKLAEKISDFYKKQGRGKHCQVENYLRQGPERHCYFAYPEDYATTDMEYEDGQLKQKGRKPAFEVIFVYRPETGMLATNAKGNKNDVQKLQEAFCKTILDLDELPDENSRIFDLEPLKKNFEFVTEPADGIGKVSLRMLQVDLPGIGKRRITFEADFPGAPQPVYKLIEDALNQRSIPLDEIKVNKAKIQFKFAPRDGKKGKTVTFEISRPNRCTLKDDPLHQIARKYLEIWGLVCSMKLDVVA